MVLGLAIAGGTATAAEPDCAAELARVATATRAAAASALPVLTTITVTHGDEVTTSVVAFVPPDRIRTRLKQGSADEEVVAIGAQVWSGEPGHLTARSGQFQDEIVRQEREAVAAVRGAEVASLPEPTARNLTCRNGTETAGPAQEIFEYDPAGREEHVTLTVETATALPSRLDERATGVLLTMTILRDARAITVEAPDGAH
jgi:hypothetical protein